MQFYRCKCGKSTAWTSMGVPACTKCRYCGSDLAQGPTTHGEPAPHKYVTKYDENTGKPYEICRSCMQTRADLEKPPEPEAPPPEHPDPYLSLVAQYPHCDQYVLHRPSSCEYCGLPENEPLHAYRREHGINYTGENDPAKKQCPAEARRAKKTIDRWPGNRARP
jgi:hypothetical protein